MKLADMTPTERKILKALSGDVAATAREVYEKSKVDYGYTRVILHYFKRIGLAVYEGKPPHGAWKLSELGSKMLKDGNDGRE